MNVRSRVAALLALFCAGFLSTSAQEPQNDSRPRLPVVGRSVGRGCLECGLEIGLDLGVVGGEDAVAGVGRLAVDRPSPLGGRWLLVALGQ